MTDTATDTAKKRRLFGGLLLLWLLPAIQTGLYMKVFRSQPPGYEATLPRPTLSAAGLWASSYQPALEAYTTQHIGFRKWLMRARNQLVFSVFDEPHSPVVVGRQGVLFEEEPLRAALGLGHALTPTEIQTRVRCLRALQDTLARRGKSLLFVIAPSKASLYPEYWPDSAQHASRRTTNYERLRGPLQASGLHLLDLGTVFRNWKRSSPYPLFPSGGIHWSGYAVPRAADTLRRFFSAHSRFELPAVHQTGLRAGGPPEGTDDDLLKLLNMFVDPAPLQPLAYPKLAFDAPRPGQPRPRVLLVADSFAWSLVEFYPYFDNWFGPGSHFWFYNREVVWPKVNGEVPPPTDVAAHDLRAKLAAHDVVLLLFSEQNLLAGDVGFSTNALATFTKPAP